MNGKERRGLSKQSSVITEPEILIEEIRTSKRKSGILEERIIPSYGTFSDGGSSNGSIGSG